MAKKFLLVNLNKFVSENHEPLKNKPLLEVKELATYDFTAEELTEFINNTSDIINFFIYPYEVEDEVTLKEDDWYNITVNDQLGVHIKRNDVGYSVDLYDVKNLSDDRFISSAIAFNDDFANEDNDD